MKKIISILLAVMLVVSVSVVSFGAYGSDGDYSVLSPSNTYAPSDSYTVDANTPYAEDAIVAAGGSLSETVTLYFQAPADWANKFNTFEGPDDDEPYMHVCIYWWSGIGSDVWPNGGTGVKWCGYQAHLVDKEYRIYAAKLPNDGGTPVVVWNNGVNGGMDESKEIFSYARQVMNLNIEGAYPEDEIDFLPEGSPNPDDYGDCIAIMDYTQSEPNPLTGFPSYGTNWYVYYGQGCYGMYARSSENFHGQFENCLNPEHYDNGDPATGTHIDIELPAEPGDANNDKVIDILDVLCIQRYLLGLPQPSGMSFDENAADVDGDGYISIIDATRIQRYLAHMCNIDGTAYTA